MLFFLSSAEYNNIQENTTKVRVHLRGGIAEIFDQHQDLMGKIDNNIVEIETSIENRIEKSLFVLQEAVFVVSTKGLGSDREKNKTAVYVYAKRAKEISSNLSLDELTKEYDNKVKVLDNLKEKKESDSKNRLLGSKILMVEEEMDFLTKTINVVKEKK